MMSTPIGLSNAGNATIRFSRPKFFPIGFGAKRLAKNAHN
jgi:hypothetical protein